MSNIYEKIQSVRVELQKLNLQKTGKNQSFKYYELKDFLPEVMELFQKHKLFSNISFGQQFATLTLINTEKTDERETWTSTIAEAKTRCSSPIQDLGAMQTYLRRYLYMNALEIVEDDMLDGNSGKKDNAEAPKKAANKSELSDNQIKRLYAIARGAGVTEEDVKKVIKKEYNKDSTKELTKKQYDAICQRMEAKADEKKANEPTAK
jgi:hypothetical protein